MRARENGHVHVQVKVIRAIYPECVREMDPSKNLLPDYVHPPP